MIFPFSYCDEWFPEDIQIVASMLLVFLAGRHIISDGIEVEFTLWIHSIAIRMKLEAPSRTCWTGQQCFSMAFPRHTLISFKESSQKLNKHVQPGILWDQRQLKGKIKLTFEIRQSIIGETIYTNLKCETSITLSPVTCLFLLTLTSASLSQPDVFHASLGMVNLPNQIQNSGENYKLCWCFVRD